MKNLFFVIATFAASLLPAQTDTVAFSVSQETGVLEKQHFVDRYDVVFGAQEPARWLLKWDAGNLISALGIDGRNLQQNSPETGLRFDAEFKISPAFSINSSYTLGFEANIINERPSNTSGFSHGFRLEPRWYFGMPRRIREGRSANNFSGNYIGLEYVNIRETPGPNSFYRVDYQGANLRFGLQRRLFRYAYFDMSYGIGVRRYPTTAFSRGSTGVFGDARLGIGLALATPKAEKRNEANYCDVFRCFEEERRMFKIDLYNMIRIGTTDRLHGVIQAAVEQKIADWPLSIEVQASVSGERYRAKYQDQFLFKIQGYAFGAQLQGRYYFDLKRRIAKGKSGNNLSGPYAAWQAGWDQYHGKFNDISDPNITTFTANTITAGPVLGVQYRLFRHGFIDFNMGAGWKNQKTSWVNNGQSTHENRPFRLQLLGALRIGLAF